MKSRSRKTLAPKRALECSHGRSAARSRASRRRAFALLELSLAAAALAVVLCLLAVIGERDRKLSMCSESLANLRQLSAAHSSFSNDNQGRICTFTWRPGVSPVTPYEDLRLQALNDGQLGAAAAQAVHILRLHAGRTDMPAASNWIPYLTYSHLPLAEYLGAELPMRSAVSPGDRILLAASSDPQAFNLCDHVPPPCEPVTPHFPYGSSYELEPAFFSHDTFRDGPTLTQALGHRFFQVSHSGAFPIRRLDEVRFPSQKAMISETFQRFFGLKSRFFLQHEARTPVLNADGGAAVLGVRTANLGFNPTSPDSPFPMYINYQPAAWEPPLPRSDLPGFERFNGSHRWTRRGLPGRDFGGPEVNGP